MNLKEVTEVIDLIYENKELRRENECLKRLLQETSSGSTPRERSEAKSLPTGVARISKMKIEEFVDNMLLRDATNIKYLPDFVEKKIYVNVFSMLLGLLEHLSETSSVEVLGHKIVFGLVSDESEKLEDPESK